jgi:hypothetical protein
MATTAGLLTACGGGSSAPVTSLDRDCGTVTAATRNFRVVNPSTANAIVIRVDTRSAAAITKAAGKVSSNRLQRAAAQLGRDAQDFVAAIKSHAVEHATSLGAALRRDAVPIAAICGLESPQVFAN